jgi:non-specific serine/threonine protein kinase
VPPLAAPELGRASAPAEVAGYAAVQLFVERAQAVEPRFALTGRNAPVVARLCARLDGLPLAIELAAASVRVLSVEQILARLDEGVRLVTGDERTAPARHRTLDATLDWSHRLLGDEERVAFRGMAVFAGGFDLAAAEAVCPDAPAANADVLDVLAGLVDRSLALKEEHDGEARYRLLEPIRPYARARLAESGEERAVRDRHAGHYLEVAERAERAVRGPEQVAWLDRLGREHANLRAALRWYLDSERADLALRLGTALWQYWRVRGHRQEAIGWLEEALERDTRGSPALRARALRLAGTFADLRCELRRARACLEESLALWRRVDDPGGLAATLCDLARVLARAAREPGDQERAMALFDEALALQREAGDAWEVAWVLYHAGRAAGEHGDLARSTACAREGGDLFASAGDRHNAAHVLEVLGEAAWRGGDLETAAGLLRESLATMRDVGCPDGIARALLGQAGLARHQGDVAASDALYRRSLTLHHELELKVGAAACLDAIAGFAAARGGLDRAARLLGAAGALREAIEVVVPPVDRDAREGAMAAARAGLAEDRFAIAFAEGRLMTLDGAVAYALDEPGA